MKKITSLILPSLIILAFIFLDNMNPYSKNILIGIYLIFPVIFIVQGGISNSKIDIAIGFGLSAMAIILPISLLYNMSSLIGPIIIYIILGLISWFIKQKLFSKH